MTVRYCTLHSVWLIDERWCHILSNSMMHDITSNTYQSTIACTKLNCLNTIQQPSHHSLQYNSLHSIERHSNQCYVPYNDWYYLLIELYACCRSHILSTSIRCVMQHHRR